MKDLLALLAHLLTTVAKLLGPGGTRAVVADSLLMKQQLLVLNRSRRRAPNLSAFDRLLFGFWSLFLTPHRIQRAAVIIRPSTLLRFHEALKKRKYRLLFVERLIGTIRREFLDQMLFWNSVDLESKLSAFRDYYNFEPSWLPLTSARINNGLRRLLAVRVHLRLAGPRGLDWRPQSGSH